jgi:hypothetical protein
MYEMKSILLALGSLLIFGNVQSQEMSDDLALLINWMTGEFSSAEQADSDTNYYDISLKMTRIWPDKKKGAWLYVEQAMAENLDEPYRQRVYFVNELGGGQFSSDVYLIPEEEKFVGAWKDPSLLSDLTQFDLKYKEGCAVFLAYDGFQFTGKTNTGTCESDLRGASYATSEVSITRGVLKSWDRGYDEEGNQVWGAEDGPYVFKKTE